MRYIVYVLFSSKIGRRYIGKTSDLKQRFKDHNGGIVSFTSHGRPWKLLYYEVFLSKKDAAAEEMFLKSGKGRERLKLLLKDTSSNLSEDHG